MTQPTVDNVRALMAAAAKQADKVAAGAQSTADSAIARLDAERPQSTDATSTQ